MSYPPQSGGPGDGVVIPASSLPTHEGADIARLTEELVKARAEVERLRQMLAALVAGRYCQAPKWSNQVGGLVACRECRTCEAALAGGLVDFGTGWATP